MSLSLEHVSHIYDAGATIAREALHDINLEIGDGEFIGLIGHTGSGKSTLIQHFNGLLKPSSGVVRYNGADIFADGYDKRALRSHVGLVFQYPEHQLFEADVFSDVCFGPKNLKLPKEEIDERARTSLQQVGLKEKYYDQSPFDLSGGQKRRVAIAGVLAMEPDVLILDEPAAGLDPAGRRESLDLIKSLYEARKMTVILVSHSMDDVAEYVERIIVMDHAHLVMDGTPAEVFAHAKELEAMGLDVPDATRICMELRSRGWEIPQTVTTLKEAKEAILKCLK